METRATESDGRQGPRNVTGTRLGGVDGEAETKKGTDFRVAAEEE